MRVSVCPQTSCFFVSRWLWFALGVLMLVCGPTKRRVSPGDPATKNDSRNARLVHMALREHKRRTKPAFLYVRKASAAKTVSHTLCIHMQMEIIVYLRLLNNRISSDVE
jgi:hypothetical protein